MPTETITDLAHIIHTLLTPLLGAGSAATSNAQQPVQHIAEIIGMYVMGPLMMLCMLGGWLLLSIGGGRSRGNQNGNDPSNPSDYGQFGVFSQSYDNEFLDPHGHGR